MKLATIKIGGETGGVFEDASGRLAKLADLGLGVSSVRAFIALGEPALKAARAHKPDGNGADPREVQWAACVPDPSKILCIALNNRAADVQLTFRPDFPVYFPKLPSALIGHGQPVTIAPHYGLVHPEPELALVVGKTARNVSPEDAMDHVFGYTIFNDITSVGMRKEDRFVAEYPIPAGDGTFIPTTEHVVYQGRYKSADGFAPMGPFLFHKDAIGDPYNLRVKCWRDDELVMDDNTSAYHFSIPEVIFWVSHHATLYPGDVIALGTALHPDEMRKPVSYADLNKSGDTVTVEIETLGTLTTPIRRIAAPDPRDAFRRSVAK